MVCAFHSVPMTRTLSRNEKDRERKEASAGQPPWISTSGGHSSAAAMDRTHEYYRPNDVVHPGEEHISNTCQTLYVCSGA